MRRDELLRRDFLKHCGLAGLSLALPFGRSSSAQAGEKDEPYAGPYYIVFNASGGWDTTYLMDPKGVEGINRLYQEGDILTHGAHKYAPTAKHIQAGMSNEDFYAEFGDQLLVVNGLDYSVNNHSPGARYMATGKLDSLAYPTFAALVAACRGPSCPLAFLTFGNYSSTGNLVAMSRVPYLPSLKKLANADAVEGNERAPYFDSFAMDRIEQALGEQAAAQASLPRLPRQERAQTSCMPRRQIRKRLHGSRPIFRQMCPRNACRNRPTWLWRRSKRGSAYRPTYRSHSSIVTSITTPTR